MHQYKLFAGELVICINEIEGAIVTQLRGHNNYRNKKV